MDVRLLERRLERCTELAELLPETSVIHGDCSNMDVLESQGFDQCDALVALTGLDETNMIVSLYAGKQGVPQVITKISRGINASIADSLALGSIVCPKELCCNNIIRYVRAMQNQTGAAISVHSIADGQAEAVEFRVDETTPNCGVPLKQLKLKPNVLIASITHGSVTEIPNGDSMFHQGDTVVVVTGGQNTIRQLNDIFV
jgi:trk system potassium uptake protein TrkA